MTPPQGRPSLLHQIGRRVSKTANGQTTVYLYDGNDIVQEIDGSAVGASYVRSLNIDEAFVRQTSSGNEFYHVDVLGSTLDLTNQAGAVQASYGYEVFGKTTVTGTSSNPFQYTGRENDGTGLYYYRARYYDPTHHRLISQDPIGLRGGINLYAYALNNPFKFRDPFGLKIECDEALMTVCDNVRNTRKGKEMWDELDQRKEKYRIKPVDTPPSFIEGQDINVNVGGPIIVDTTAGPQPQCQECSLAHEMGHAVSGLGGDQEMAVIDQYENPVRGQLANPPQFQRTSPNEVYP